MLKEYLKENQPLYYRLIENEFKDHKIPHAFLLSGNNVDKPLEFLEMSLLCDDLLACETCIDCQKVKNHSYADIIEIDGEQESIKTEHIEKIQSTFKKSALEGKCKIYVIKKIENSSPKAINSLLKMLEEPVEGIYAILTTQNMNKVLPTIISRCQVIEIKRDKRETVKKNLLEKGYNDEQANVRSIIYDQIDCRDIEDEDFDKIMIESLNFIEDLFLHRENLLINTQIHIIKDYKDKKYIKLFLSMIIIGFKDMFHVKHNEPIIFSSHNQLFESIEYENDDIIKKMEKVLETLSLLDTNANIPLLMDSMMYRL